SMTQNAPVAVVVPVYNRRIKLIKTLESVCNQSELPSLLIVVDDGSNDGSAEAARSWLSTNTLLDWRVITQPNGGVSVARNTGFAHIGDLPYVCFLDSDDLWPRNFITEALRAFEGRGDVVAAVADRIKETSGKRERARSFESVSQNALLWLLFNGGAILSCTMMRSSAARAAGLFDPGMRVRQDLDFFIRLFLLGGAAHSKADPVLCIKGTPLETTEPANNSASSLRFKYEGAWDLNLAVSKIPKALYREHEPLIRTAMARRWASVAHASKRVHNHRLAFNCLIQAMRWDFLWRRRLRLIWFFFQGNKSLADFRSPFVEPGPKQKVGFSSA
ncbi:MAG TPA: glycosyltransferase family A protein, partial [Nitrososphaera sp.]|nr:glycosyltransferase family A protein [Nitrososphaera sp.]